MSIVGTRPPTLDEWNKYELHHRARLAMVLPLTNEQGEKISLEMPDLSGEYYRKLVEERYIDKKIYDELQQADVILFFLNPETMEREERIKCEETSAIRMVDEDMDIENVPGSEVRITEPRKATETQVVELLQILLYIVKKKMCIKFVISAWDRVEKKQEGIYTFQLTMNYVSGGRKYSTKAKNTSYTFRQHPIQEIKAYMY